MRRFAILACTWLIIMTRVVIAQEPADGISLAQYAMALNSYADQASMGMTMTGFGQTPGPKEVSLTHLATLDPTLSKAPTIKGLTLGILRNIDSLEAARKSAEAKQQANQKRMTSSEANQSNRNPNRPPKSFEIMADNGKIQSELMNKVIAVKEAIQSSMALIAKQETTPEGQNFSMPETSAFLARISPMYARSQQAPRDPSVRLAEFERFEVASSSPEGFIGYLMKIVRNADGSSSKDAEGNYLFAPDRSKSYLIRGYTKPVSLGDELRIKVVPVVTETATGTKIGEYVFQE